MKSPHNPPKKFLFVMTSHNRLGDTGKKTGFHFSEMAEPYFILEDHGVEVTLASIKGGNPPVDPESLSDPGDKKELVDRFRQDGEAMAKLSATPAIDTVSMAVFEGIYLPGGHGTMWDFADNPDLKSLIDSAWRSGKIIAAVCHGPAGLVSAVDEYGDPLVKNRYVNSFTNEEERKIRLDKVMPFMLETALREKGALFEAEAPEQAYMAQDSRLITGQNPASASLVANAILRCLGLSPYTADTVQAAERGLSAAP